MASSIAKVTRMSVAAVRKRKREEALEEAGRQSGVTRCVCGWYFRGFFREGRQAFQAHRSERCKLTREAA